jgi:hypothetical protein
VFDGVEDGAVEGEEHHCGCGAAERGAHQVVEGKAGETDGDGGDEQ